MTATGRMTASAVSAWLPAPAAARIALRGRGASLPLPAPVSANAMFAHDPAVTAQLVNGDGACWDARYVDARANRADMFARR